MLNENEYMPSILDCEVNSILNDAFGHQDFTKALESLIESSRYEPPYSIGLLGKWGTGKSSIKSMYLTNLSDDQNKDSNGKKRSDKFHTITFNAWRYGGENIKRALLRQVYLDLYGNENKLNDVMDRQIQRTTLEDKSWQTFFKELYNNWLVSLLQILFATIPASFVLVKVLEYLNITDELYKTITSFGVMLFQIVLIKFFLNPKRYVVSRYSNVTKTESPISYVEQYEKYLVDQLFEFKTNIKAGKNCEKIVIFIDDLDRLPADEMVNGLDAIRSFMEIPKSKLPKGLGIVFVISCDEERVADALANRKSRSLDLPSTIFNHDDARRFLDRIFQFRLEISQPPRQDMRNFVISKINELPFIIKDFENREINISAVVERLIHPGVQSPRKALQILNCFTQSWWLAQIRERSGSGTERTGALQEGVVTNYPLPMAAICVLKIDFPQFYNDLLVEPNFINSFINYFIRHQSSEDETEISKNILQNYFDSEGNLRSIYRPLRQYISSLQGIQWPRSLQPLLLLSQDSITRKYGDKSTPIYDALVSGDYQEILTLLGRDLDNKELTKSDISLIKLMNEDLYRENSIRQNNAYSAIAALSTRIPAEYSKSLFDPLIRKVIESPELRWRIGLSKILEITSIASINEQKDIVGILIDDLLRLDGEVKFKKENGKLPTLDEATLMVKQVCEFTFEIWNQFGLSTSIIDNLQNWLEVRRISVNKKEYALPIEVLEKWIDEYENILLPAMGSRYTQAIINEFGEESSIKGVNNEAFIRKSEVVFNKLLESGEEDNTTLWNQVCEYVSVKPKEIVTFAWTYMNKHYDTVNKNIFSKYMNSFALRLKKNMEDDENWDLDWESGADTLLAMLNARRTDVDSETLNTLNELTLEWSYNSSTAEFSVRFIDIIFKEYTKHASKIIDHWIPNILSTLEDEPTDWLSANFMDRLSIAQRNNIIAQISAASQNVSISEKVGGKYRRFINNLSDDSLNYSELQTHIVNLFTTISNNYSNFNYLKNVFQVVPQIIECSPPSSLGSLLHSLFANSKGYRDIYSWLHSNMSSHWPKPDASLSPYSPQNIFNEARSLIVSESSSIWTINVLLSLNGMIRNDVIGRENTTLLIEAACILWPINKEKCSELILSYNESPTPQYAANLMNSINLNNIDERGYLYNTWSHITNIMDEDERFETTRHILANPISGTKNEPDACLLVWLTAQEKYKLNLITRTLTDEEIIDEHKKRIWLHAENLSKELGPNFFLDILPEIVALNNAPNTLKSVFESKETITNLFKTISEKHGLGMVLMAALSKSNSLEVKNNLASWLKELDNSSIVRDFAKCGITLDDDIRILSDHFPNAKSLKKALNR